MGSFKQFLKENEEFLSTINDIVNNMSADEVDEFGFYLYSEFFEEEDEEHHSDAEGREDAAEDEAMYFGADNVMEMIQELGAEYYEDILDMLDEIPDEDYEEDAEEYHGGDLEEGVTRRLLNKNRNRKKRKFMAQSKSALRRTAAKRKRANRQNKAARKRYYKANKNKIKAYQKSRNDAIKKGKHKPKLRRQSG